MMRDEELWVAYRAAVPPDFIYTDAILEQASEDHVMKTLVRFYVGSTPGEERESVVLAMGMRMGEAGHRFGKATRVS